MSGLKGMVVKILLAYGPDCDWSMAWLGRGLLLVLCRRLGVMLTLPGVAILVRGAVVPGPVVLGARCLEQGLPTRVRSRGVGVGP